MIRLLFKSIAAIGGKTSWKVLRVPSLIPTVSRSATPPADVWIARFAKSHFAKSHFAKRPGSQRLIAGTNVMTSNVISSGIKNGIVPRVTV